MAAQAEVRALDGGRRERRRQRQRARGSRRRTARRRRRRFLLFFSLRLCRPLAPLPSVLQRHLDQARHLPGPHGGLPAPEARPRRVPGALRRHRQRRLFRRRRERRRRAQRHVAPGPRDPELEEAEAPGRELLSPEGEVLALRGADDDGGGSGSGSGDGTERPRRPRERGARLWRLHPGGRLPQRCTRSRPPGLELEPGRGPGGPAAAAAEVRGLCHGCRGEAAALRRLRREAAVRRRRLRRD